MSNFKVADVVRAKVGYSPYFKPGDIGVVVGVEFVRNKLWLLVDFNRACQEVYEDGRWYIATEEAAPWLGITKPALSGHSGEHDGLQNHSVSKTYPYAVVTYGHEPAIHTIENLRTGEVAGYDDGGVRQWLDAGHAFNFLNIVVDKADLSQSLLGPVVWLKGRPRNVMGKLVIKPDTENQRAVLDFFVDTVGRLKGRPLSPHEVYQLAAELDQG